MKCKSLFNLEDIFIYMLTVFQMNISW